MRWVAPPLLSCVTLATALVGCAGAPRGTPQQQTPQLAITPAGPATAPVGMTEPTFDPELSADVAPPQGWRLEQKSESDRHDHETWVSPTGRTAYGVVFFRMPLPVGPDLALRYGFLPQMRRAEGEATLVSKAYDPAVGGLRFVVEGGLYRVRSTMFTRGTRGWAVYAGTLRKEPVDEAEHL